MNLKTEQKDVYEGKKKDSLYKLYKSIEVFIYSLYIAYIKSLGH